MKILRYLWLAPIFLFLACGGKKVEEVAEKFPDGSPKIVYTYFVKGEVREKIKEVQYYPNHQLYVEGEYSNNKRDGKWTVWHQNGNIWSEGYFDKGLNDGRRTTYHENGEKYTEGKYDEGKMIGTWRIYDEKGKLVKEVDYDKN